MNAHTVLYLLGTVLGLWGMSLVVRGVIGDRAKGLRRCPQCRADVASGLACGACGFEAEREKELRSGKRDWRLIGGGLVPIVLAPGVFYAGIVVQSAVTEYGEFEAGLAPWYGAGAGIALFGALLVFTGWRGDRSKGRRRCAKCWYDMSASNSLLCSECGHEAKNIKGLYKPRRRTLVASIGVLLLLASLTPLGAPRYNLGGWVALIPTPVMILGIDVFPDRVLVDDQSNAWEDWTLLGRLFDDMPAWQMRWVQRRSASSLAGARSLDGAMSSWMLWSRASEFLEDETAIEDLTFGRRITSLMLEELTSEDPVVRANAEAMLDYYSWVGDAGHGDVVAPYADELVEMARTSSNTTVVLVVLNLLADAGDDRGLLTAIELFDAEMQAPAGRQPGLVFLFFNAEGDAGIRDAMFERAGSASARVRGGALTVLSGDKSDPSITDVLMHALEDPNDRVCADAARALLRRKMEMERVFPAVLAHVTSDRENRDQVVSALLQFDQMSVDHLDEILVLLEDEDGEVVSALIMALEWFVDRHDIDVRPLAPRVARAMERDDVTLRTWSAQYWANVLGEMNGP